MPVDVNTPLTQDQMVREFARIRTELVMLQSAIKRVSVYAAQSAAFRDLGKWMAKGDKIEMGLKEMKL